MAILRIQVHSDAMEEADRDDAQATLAGDGRAYERIVRRHQEAIALRMRRFARGPGEREELVHDVFVEVYRSLANYHGRAPLLHWINRIATRVGYRHWKRRKAERGGVSIQECDVPAGERQTDPRLHRLHDVLEQLPPRDRLVLTLLYLEQRSVAEAADLAGWSRTMVKVQAFRARSKLKKLLQNEEEPA